MHRKKPCGAGLRPTGTISLEEHRVGGTKISRLIRTPSSLSACWRAVLTNFDFGSLSCSKSAPSL